MDFLDYLYQTVKRGLELGYGIRTLFLHNQVCLGLFDLPIQNYIYKDGIPRHHIFRDFCIQNLQAFDYILLFVPLISSSFQCNSLLFPPSQQLLPEQQLRLFRNPPFHLSTMHYRYCRCSDCCCVLQTHRNYPMAKEEASLQHPCSD